MYQIKINQLPMQPRERLYLLGAKKLSDAELLGILLRTGIKSCSATQLAEKLLAKYDNLAQFEKASVEELVQQTGIGFVKAVEIKAMIELGQRIYCAVAIDKKRIIDSATFSNHLMLEMGSLEQEHLIAFYLDTKNQIIRQQTIFIGSINQSIAHPREILYHAVKSMAANVILAHNHPSGSALPSQEDRSFTQKMKESCLILGINLLDHIVVGKRDYYSFMERGEI
ncbi:MAG: DNA repair protein RadC [Streptococcaceae bacterium]|jgi:DNA repair protein RadC|nr:DNA repair protein RadC [Streptococcaceae bacterium]